MTLPRNQSASDGGNDGANTAAAGFDDAAEKARQGIAEAKDAAVNLSDRSVDEVSALLRGPT
jgi:hypothetical protein